MTSMTSQTSVCFVSFYFYHKLNFVSFMILLFEEWLPLLQQQHLLFLLNEQLAGMEWNGVGILSEQI